MKKHSPLKNHRETNRKKLRAQNLRFESLETRYVMDGSVVINEIMYHPDAPTATEGDYEWVELYNQMSINMDISGWRLEGAVQYTFAEGTVIPGRGYKVISSNPTALAGLGINGTSGPFVNRLGNGSDEVILVNRDGRQMSIVEYDDSDAWPVGPDGSGFSLAKQNQYAASSDPASWRASRQYFGTPGTANFPLGADPGPALAFNEIPAASASGFWVEIVNQGTTSINLNGYSIKNSAGTSLPYTFSSQTIAPGQILLIDQSALGFGAVNGDALFLYSPGTDRLVDARQVTTGLRGLEASHGLDWLYPTTATPGAANAFQLNSDIVINEVMYHAIPNYPINGSTNTAKLVGIDATTNWRYNQAGVNLGTTWASTSHPVNGTSWVQGPGVLAFESSSLTVFNNFPIRTTLNDPLSNPTTYYETDFTFSGSLSDVVELKLGHIVDDGAVFYLNGVEVLRYNMPAGGITFDTLASAGVESSYVGPVTIPKSALIVGVNRLSVEVHQVSSTTDVVMGAELSITSSSVPTVPFSESPEEWVELYNKGAAPVDLSGWKFAEGITYTFPNGTIIPAGGYLVVAKDNVALKAKYPAISGTIIGNFSGSLANSTDAIALNDQRGNPVDWMRYYDSANWHEAADGGGSSLELRSPNMDNTKAEAWGPSSEGSKSDWNTYTYTMTAANDIVGPASQWNEFLFGFIQSGEMLIDDVSVISNPGTGNAIQLIQNGSFQTDAVGASPAKWRLIGNHSGSVITDPTNVANKVLRLVSTGRTDHEGNNAGTTLAGNTAISIGTTYQVTFRAKWITGSPQINSRLYFAKVSDTIAIAVPHNNGTPGAQNSNYVANAGPTYSELKHGPVLPAANQVVTISVRANDPDGITSMTLFYSVENGSFNSVAMTLGANGLYTGTIPGQSAGASVQFYVRGIDSLGAISFYPSTGANSRAMYEVNDGLSSSTPIESIRIVAKSTEAANLLNVTNLMSNQNIGATIIYNDSEVFYNVGIRLKGSSASRGSAVWGGSYAIEFNPDQLFRGVYEEISLDSSGRGPGGAGSTQQQVQILVNQILNHAGNGLASNYDDFAFVVSPNTTHTGIDALQLARYSNDYLDETYANGSDGNLYEYELVYYTKSTVVSGDVEALKNQNNEAYVNTIPQDLGDDPDRYRWTTLLKNNREGQDFSKMIALMKAFSLTDQALIDAVSQVADVDQWLRTMAAASAMGVSDTFATSNNYHNINFFVRPSDGKIVMLPWDWDEAFRLGATSTIHPGTSTGVLKKLLSFTNDHLYFSHLYDIATHEFTTDYMAPWTSHLGSMGVQVSGFNSVLSYIGNRRTSILSQINGFVPANTQFNITTNGGNPLNVTTATATLNGTGYVDFHTIRVRGSATPLEMTWSSYTNWQVTVPLTTGANNVILDAYDVRGNLVHSDSITVNTTFTSSTPLNSLRISELHYNPAAPPSGSAITDAQEYEFIELKNIGTGVIDLKNVAFTTGVTFTFPNVTFNVQPGEYIVLVKNPAAFAARYGNSIPIAGTFSGNLSNGGERLVLVDASGQTIHDFTFQDASWIPAADGPGFSMVAVDPATALSAWGTAAGWRRSANLNGSPGGVDPTPSIALSLSNNSIVENSAAGSTVGILTSADPDVAETFTYAFVTGAGSNDNTLFTLVGNQLRIISAPDYESQTSYSVRLKTTNSRGFFSEYQFTVNVIDLGDFSVTNSNDSGAGSLRQAILDSNASTAPNHTIQFALPTSGSSLISVLGDLPAITHSISFVVSNSTSGMHSTVTIGANNSFTLGGYNSLQFSGGGSLTLNTPVIAPGNTTIAGGTLQIARGLSGSGNLIVNGGGKLITDTVIRQQSITINGAGSKVVFMGNPDAYGVVIVNDLVIGNGATLDLNNNDLILSYAGNIPNPTLVNTIKQYINNAFEGTAGVPQITSTSAFATPGTTLVTLDNALANIGDSDFPFHGQVLGPNFNQVIVRFAYFGDYNLDGSVNSVDYGIVDSRFGQSGSWLQGDGNGNGVIDAADYALIDSNYGKSLFPPPPEQPAALPASQPAVAISEPIAPPAQSAPVDVPVTKSLPIVTNSEPVFSTIRSVSKQTTLVDVWGAIQKTLAKKIDNAASLLEIDENYISKNKLNIFRKPR